MLPVNSKRNQMQLTRELMEKIQTTQKQLKKSNSKSMKKQQKLLMITKQRIPLTNFQISRINLYISLAVKKMSKLISKTRKCCLSFSIRDWKQRGNLNRTATSWRMFMQTHKEQDIIGSQKMSLVTSLNFYTHTSMDQGYRILKNQTLKILMN